MIYSGIYKNGQEYDEKIYQKKKKKKKKNRGNGLHHLPLGEIRSSIKCFLLSCPGAAWGAQKHAPI